MTDTTERWPGVLITVDGPGGVGKTTATRHLLEHLQVQSIPVHGTTQPSRTALGDMIRQGTDTYQGMALGCLVAGDRHQQLATEIVPNLRAGKVVICDRYLPSSLVLQRIDGLTAQTVWNLNAGVYMPDLAVILHGDPTVIAARLRGRGGHSRFERPPDASARESDLYEMAVTELQARHWAVLVVDCTDTTPGRIADTIATAIRPLTTRWSTVCPS
jgi:dTMP kinase